MKEIYRPSYIEDQQIDLTDLADDIIKMCEKFANKHSAFDTKDVLEYVARQMTYYKDNLIK